MKMPVIAATEILSSRALGAALERLNVPRDQTPSVYSERLREAIAGRLVYIGRVDRSGAESTDRQATPYAFPWFQEADMAGVFIQAQLAQAILNGDRIRHLSGWVEWLLAAFAALGALYAHRRLPVALQVVTWSLGSAVTLGIGCLLFRFGGGLVLELGAPISAFALTLCVLHVYDKFSGR